MYGRPMCEVVHHIHALTPGSCRRKRCSHRPLHSCLIQLLCTYYVCLSDQQQKQQLLSTQQHATAGNQHECYHLHVMNSPNVNQWFMSGWSRFTRELFHKPTRYRSLHQSGETETGDTILTRKVASSRSHITQNVSIRGL